MRHGARVEQETGFLNRQIVVRGVVRRFQVYLPEQWRRDDHKQWPIILFLHGRGERGAEGMWQTQVGLPQAVRDHPERWPFVIVMPQCPMGSFWTDPESLALAMTALDQESEEFHGDPQRTYLAGLSMGGYGAWELVRQHPRRWAAVSIAASGVFWSYAPERWQRASSLPAEYARALGHTAAWLFHGTEDSVVQPKQDELLYEAIKADGGRVRLWLFQGLHHDCWTRAFNEPDLPRWLLAHHIETVTSKQFREPPPYAERTVIPLHPPAIRLSAAQLDALAGEYQEPHGRGILTLIRQNDQLIERDQYGSFTLLGAESASVFFYPNGSSITRIQIERDSQGRIESLVLRDDRHEERWERKSSSTQR
ncbi:MAG: alpha/beta hydrolase-fold protein [Terracidiphilus sp.]|nr:alpha/beta hydrolase-fold protein [Terracidiphilus sp.]